MHIFNCLNFIDFQLYFCHIDFYRATQETEDHLERRFGVTQSHLLLSSDMCSSVIVLQGNFHWFC